MVQDLFVGVDIAKNWLDISHPNRRPSRIANTPEAARELARSCFHEGAWVIFEATGGYDRTLRDALGVSMHGSAASIHGKHAISRGRWA